MTDFGRLLDALATHDVSYIIIGGFAIGFVYYALLQIFKIMKEIPEKMARSSST